MKKLSDIGDFAAQRNELQDKIDESDGNINEVNIFRYQKKTDFIKYVGNYWFKIVNMISNRMIDPSDEISVHYDMFREFGLENKLFGQITEMSSGWIGFIKMVQAKSSFPHLNAEMISKMTHYAIIMLFIDTLEMAEDVKKKTGVLAKEVIPADKKEEFTVDEDGSLVVKK